MASVQGPGNWKPDTGRALSRFRERNRVYVMRRRRWTWIAAAASLACLSILAVPGRCDSPGSTSCGQPLAGRLWYEIFPKHQAIIQTPPLTPQAVPPATVPPAIAQAQKPEAPRIYQTPPAAMDFKVAGSPDAPVTCEIYTDYECPFCAVFYRQTIAPLIEQYVRTGKVKLVHRDFPLPQHSYARLAARYANAAGRLGHYEVAVNHLFETQNLWSGDGSIDTQLAQVLTPRVMQKVRDLVRNDATLDDTVATDIAMAARDGIKQTPTIMVVSKGNRQIIVGVPDFSLLKSYLDELLAKQ